MPFSKLKEMFSAPKGSNVELDNEYIEVDASTKSPSAKISIRTFNIASFEDIKPILNILREGRTVALINIAPIKDSDRMGLKRAVDKLKKTLDANDGDIAAFGEHWLVATPAFAKIYRQPEPTENNEVD